MKWLTAGVSSIVVLLAAAACGGNDGPGFGAQGDEDQIRQLSQTFIDLVKEERWSKAYSLYSKDFRDRCDRDGFAAEFDLAKASLGEAQWNDIRESLKLIAVDEINVEGDAATANVTMEALDEQETGIGYYVKEDGEWGISPAPASEGCDPRPTIDRRLSPWSLSGSHLPQLRQSRFSAGVVE